MNHQHNRAGQSTRLMAEKRYKNRVWFVLLAAGSVTLLLLAALNTQALGIGGIGFLALIISARLLLNLSDRRARRMVKEERRAVRGAKGEENVGSILQTLGEDFLVVHDVKSPFGNIDHIVISEHNRIFLIETKAHGGRVSNGAEGLLVNGRQPEKDFITQVLSNTYWLRDEVQSVVNLEVWVNPVLVFTNAFVERMPPINGIIVTHKKFLLPLLKRKSSRTPNRLIWEQREKILRKFC
jgi:hypothetical protein